MNKKVLIFSTTSIMLLSGCVAHMEQMPGSVSTMKYAPVNIKQQNGLISYDYGATIQKKDAYKQMYKVCNGKYEIIREFEKNDGAALIPYGAYSQYGGALLNIEKKYIEFKCVK